ncbi:BTA121 domain-containing protein surface lipoprotein [Borrelia crocidurae]|uniref:Putative lipoprotein n=1 Tax=Borrelia crocidurae (strain Achema) TaxID=1155096 RepID=I0FEA4_BORCA|nr:hypothetical protein [Borrelia crocidurae]AFI31810.1 Putative lipoprotein [Borrelia crocidurae str. Achema]
MQKWLVLFIISYLLINCNNSQKNTKTVTSNNDYHLKQTTKPQITNKYQIANNTYDTNSQFHKLILNTTPKNTKYTFTNIVKKFDNKNIANKNIHKTTAKQIADSQSSTPDFISNLIAQLNSKENEALNFLTEVLKDNNIVKDSKTYTDKEVNDFIKYLKPQQIKKMIANIQQALKFIENIESNIKKIYDYKKQKTELNNRLKNEINNYKIALKKASNQKSFDTIKTNIQNTSINLTEITNIQNEAKRAIDVQEISLNLTDDELCTLFSLVEPLQKINYKTSNKHYTYDQFNQFILYLGIDKIKDMLKNIVKEFHKAKAVKYYTKKLINNKNIKNNLADYLEFIKQNYKRLLIEAFGNSTISPDVIIQNIKKISFDGFDKIKQKAISTIKNQLYK